MLQIYGSPKSRLTRVTWMCEELNLDYKIVAVKPGTPELLAVNPDGKGPVLVDGDLKVIDSAAICLYLADKEPAQKMSSPSGSPQRAQIDSWMHFAQLDLEAPLWLKLKHSFILPEDQRLDVRSITAADFKRAVRAMENRLGNNQFAIGDQFTAADVLLGHTGSWARGAKFSIESDSVNAYLDRVLARPALARARALEASL